MFLLIYPMSKFLLKKVKSFSVKLVWTSSEGLSVSLRNEISDLRVFLHNLQLDYVFVSERELDDNFPSPTDN